MSGAIYAGDLRLAKIVAGVQQGYDDTINALKFSISKEGGDTKQRLSKGRDDYNRVLDAVSIPGYDVLSIETDEAGTAVLADILMGDETDLSVVDGTVDVGSPEDVTASLGKWSRLAHRDVSSVVIKDATDTTTYVNGTDYLLDAKAGMIKALSTGSIGDGDVLHFSGAYGAVSGKRVTASTKSELRVACLFDGVNLATQKKVVIEITDVPLTSDGELDLASADFVASSWTGSVAGTITVDELD